MKNLKYKIFFCVLTCLMGLVFFQFASADQSLWEQIKPPTISEMAQPNKTAGEIIRDVVLWIMGLIGALAVGFIVFGAIRYITSAGNEKMVEEAKKMILYAIIGFVIAILAVVIVQLVGSVMANSCEKSFGNLGYKCINGQDGDYQTLDPADISNPSSQCKTGKVCNGDYCCGENIDSWCCKP